MENDDVADQGNPARLQHEFAVATLDQVAAPTCPARPPPKQHHQRHRQGRRSQRSRSIANGVDHLKRLLLSMLSNELFITMNAKALEQAMARKAYRKRRLRAKIKAVSQIPDLRPSLVGWQPLVRIPTDPISLKELIATEPFTVAAIDVFANNKWRVLFTRGTGEKPFWHICIAAQDGSEPTWAECQAIKNQLVGTDQEMVQLFPAETRMVNARTMYHLWGVMGVTIPLGWRNGKLAVLTDMALQMGTEGG